MYRKKFFVIIALILLFSPSKVIFAQEDGELPVYVVLPGENLTEIAGKFNISLNELISANNILDINLISAGTQLVIPGLEGVSGVLKAEPVAFGDQFQAILKRNKLSLENFKKLNPVTSPSEIYAGATLVLPELLEADNLNSNTVMNQENSLFTTAIQIGKNPWVIFQENFDQPALFLPGDGLYYHSIEEATLVTSFSSEISEIDVNPLPMVQGHTVAVYIYAKQHGIFIGSLGEKPLTFFEDESNGFYYSLNGISAIAAPGLVPLKITGILEDGEEFSVQQNILLTSGGYPNETLTVEQTTVEQEIVQKENDQIQQILSPVTSKRFWTSNFRFPVDGSLDDGTIAFSSYFGSRRSYNNGQYSGYHGGLDFSVVLMSLNIYAPGPGQVIFTGLMNIRGNTLFIDHGQGVVSGYAHLNEFKVNVGDFVEEGQLIGIIGKTGRVTGPHLHWDIWVNGTQVDPFDWTNNTYP